MNARERVHAALRREPTDRVPIFMWFHPDTARRLGELLEIPPARVAEAMGNDIRQTWVANNYAMEGIVHEREGESHVDLWGVEWVKVGPFNQIRRSPLRDAGRDEILGYEYPYDGIDPLLANMDRSCHKLRGGPRTLLAATYRPACLRWFAGCAAWSTPPWTWLRIPRSRGKCWSAPEHSRGTWPRQLASGSR